MKKPTATLKQAPAAASSSSSSSLSASPAEGALARVRRELRGLGYPIGSDPLDYAEQPGGGIIFIAPDGRKFRL
jgi:hypothetical protein